MAYTPNKAIHPGQILAEILSREQMTQKSLSDRTGISEKHLSQIINGEASITVETALLLENVLGGTASFWNNLEKNYQETKARLDRSKVLKEEVQVLSRFPYLELARRGFVEQTTNREKRVENLWKFFGVNSLSYVLTTETVAFRKRVSHNVKKESIAAWLRCGELEAKKVELPDFSESKVKESLNTLKTLSIKNPMEYSRETIDILNKAGIALVFIEHFPGTGVSGAVRWVSNMPVIQLSLYYPWADVFWFNLYHELGHLVLHGKKEKFIEYDKTELAPNQDKENEANMFASDMLISRKKYDEFVDAGVFNRRTITDFAQDNAIHPGIVAGRLCHEKHIDWKYASQLRPRLKLVLE